ncbi:TonB-dependent receptor domain-containing protein [Novosphingobium sp. Leaf2]|uniref:TonB-dependent receptor domain-containing protein n=1 Tax=Novosphingobium sp. Leaf2 TaxID=1735670 RepID=UPI0009EC2DED|nr:TonB-dependent receptor [Novosphingobium sp. Leaf2]
MKHTMKIFGAAALQRTASAIVIATAMMAQAQAQAQAQNAPAQPALQSPAAVPGTLPPAQAPATSTADVATADSSASTDDIVVTGSRLSTTGFTAPSPTTVLGSALLERQGQSNVAEFINQIPAVRSSATSSTSTATSFRGGAGGNFVNLRGLGVTRTLVLIDSERVVPTTTTGTLDLNIIPSIMLDRVEVVTGGASAAYGSDAVAGVVNLILKKKFVGLQAEGQTGVTQYGDNQTYRAGIIGGFNFGTGGHVLLGGDYAESAGIGTLEARDWSRRAGGIVAGANGVQYLVNDLQINNQTYGGIINSGPLRGTAFGPGSVPYSFTYGNTFGNASSTTQQGGGNPRSFNYDAAQISMPYKRYTALARVDYEFSPAFNLHATVNYANSGAPHTLLYARDAALSIRSDNAFLPQSVRAQMATAGVSTITVGRISRDLGPYVYSDNNTLWRGSVGVDGALGGGWKYDAYVGYGRNKIDYDLTTRIDGALPGDPAGTRRFLNAIDAVTNSAGQIVCRVNQVTVTSPGCAPFNIFGENPSLTAAQQAWLVGTQHVSQITERTSAAANIAGSPFATWAGEVSVAVGAEYRRDSQDVTVDAGSLARAFNLGNTQPIAGSTTVYEGYGEVGVPLLRDVPFFQSLEANGAVRQTHYSQAGNVTTWKGGLTWEVNDSLRFRGTRSRDIRAPNLSELFQPLTTSQNAVIYNGVSTLANTRTTGNPNLKPERADTLSFGFVLSPTFLRGFRFSVDYYDIRLRGAIATVASQALINGCQQQGLADYCSRISVVNGVPLIDSSPANLNSIRTSGLDFELAYGFWALGGRFDLSTYATYVDKFTTSDALGTFNRAGEISGGFFFPGDDTPHWTGSANVNYNVNHLNILANIRYTGSSVLDKFAPAGKLVGPNKVPAIAYLNLSAEWTVPTSTRGQFQFFGGIDNVFNTDPPSEIPYQYFNRGTAASYYDVAGRRFRFGARVRY